MVNVTVGECPITPVSCETFEQNRRGGTAWSKDNLWMNIKEVILYVYQER